ncbi:VWA domain-containing protein, partial [Candidatus Thorarchaeota archaeon]
MSKYRMRIVLMRRRMTRLTVCTLLILMLTTAAWMAADSAGAASRETTSLIADDTLEPSSVSVEGTILDNYANFTYTMAYDNTESEEDQEVFWLFGLQSGLRLSNMCVALRNVIYWGRVDIEQEAIETYNESVALNKTAVLVTRHVNGYAVNFNVENNTEAVLTVFIEGLLTRNSGRYTLELPISKEAPIESAFSLDMSIVSHYGDIIGYSVHGITGFLATAITDGIRIEYDDANMVIPSELAIQYATERQTGGSQLLTYNNGSENFFVYLLAPTITEVDDIKRRQFVFVVDTSGSMSGTPIEQAKIAFSAMVDDMRQDDLFNVIEFDDEVRSLWVEPHQASGSAKTEAKSWINGLTADGSTNFYGAVVEGLDMFTSGDSTKVMLVLSDGQPTSGYSTNPDAILSAAAEANDQGVSVSTVAFGSGADEGLMANLAAENNGFFAIIQPYDDAATRLMDFYRLFSTPIADSYDIDFTGASEVNSLQPLEDTPFFNGTEVVVTGRYEESISIDTWIDYSTGPEQYSNTHGTGDTDKPHIERLWAQQRISYLLRQMTLEGESDVLRDEVIGLAMTYGLVVEGYTALILTAYEVTENGELATTGTTPTAITTTTTMTTTSATYQPGADPVSIIPV